MVTAVSGFIEQVDMMIKGIPKHNYRQGSLNRWIVWLKEFQNTIILHHPPHNSIKLQC